MADVAPEVKETVAEKEVEITETEESEKNEKDVKNGDTETEEKPENGVEDRCALKNGNVKQNGIAAEKEETESSDGPAESNEVCGIKRKSVSSEGAEAEVESSEKKQKVEGSTEPDVATNGEVEAKA